MYTTRAMRKLDALTYPDLQLDALVMPKDRLDLEVDAHGWDEGRCEAVVRVAEEETRLAHARVADDEQLEHVVEVLIGRILLPLGISTTSHSYVLQREKEEEQENELVAILGISLAWLIWIDFSGLLGSVSYSQHCLNTSTQKLLEISLKNSKTFKIGLYWN